MRSSEKRVASTGERILISRPAVSWSVRYCSTFWINWRSWARSLSSQNTAGAPEARARVTASLTQSRIGASLAWQARQMSPVWTVCSSRTLPSAATTRITPSLGTSNVLSCEPYSSAFLAISPTFETLPMVTGS